MSSVAYGWTIVGVSLALLIAMTAAARTMARSARLQLGDNGRVLLVRLCGFAVGLVGAYRLVRQPGLPGGASLGRLEMLAPVFFGFCVLLASVLGELVLRRPRPGVVRIASIRPRRVRDYLPRWLTRLVASLVVALTVLLVATTLTASPDDLGRPGRWLTQTCETPAGVITSAGGPYPGSFYSVPLAGAVATCLVLAGFGLWRIVVRPRGVAPDGEGGDDLLRRWSARDVMAGLGVAIGGPLAGCGLFAAVKILGSPCATALGLALGWVSVGIALGAAVSVCVCLGVLLAGRRVEP